MEQKKIAAVFTYNELIAVGFPPIPNPSDAVAVDIFRVYCTEHIKDILKMVLEKNKVSFDDVPNEISAELSIQAVAFDKIRIECSYTATNSVTKQLETDSLTNFLRNKKQHTRPALRETPSLYPNDEEEEIVKEDKCKKLQSRMHKLLKKDDADGIFASFKKLEDVIEYGKIIYPKSVHVLVKDDKTYHINLTTEADIIRIGDFKCEINKYSPNYLAYLTEHTISEFETSDFL